MGKIKRCHFCKKTINTKYKDSFDFTIYLIQSNISNTTKLHCLECTEMAEKAEYYAVYMRDLMPNCERDNLLIKNLFVERVT